MFVYVYFFLFKHKTAYEMCISDWSSDVCSSDLFRVRLEDASFASDRKCILVVDARPCNAHHHFTRRQIIDAELIEARLGPVFLGGMDTQGGKADRKSTRLNSSH